MEKGSVIVEHIYNAPVEIVWKAITDAEQMKQWWLDVPGFKAEVGYKFDFRGGPKQYHHLCEVKEVIEESKLSYSWRFAEFPGDSLVTWELFAAGNKTKVILTHSGIETFRGDIHPEMKIENFMGWTHVLDKMLKEFVEQ